MLAGILLLAACFWSGITQLLYAGLAFVVCGVAIELVGGVLRGSFRASPRERHS